MRLRQRHFATGLLLALCTWTVQGAGIGAREHVFIVGSSSVFPIVSAAAEYFSRGGKRPSPVVESTGSGGGFKAFCAGLGAQTPDITMASRRIKDSEVARCKANHVADVIELKIGYGGVTLANGREQTAFVLTPRQIYLALARRVPMVDTPGRTVPNPYSNWRQIDPGLPDQRILVYGPPPTSGTRDILVEQVIEPACRELEAGDDAECGALREDGAYVNAGENDSRVVRKLLVEPDALGILGFNFLDRNPDKLQGASISGVLPEYAQIEAGRYPISRPLYLYIKGEHLGRTPGLHAFLTTLTSDALWGPDGHLADKGLIPLHDNERQPWLRQR